VNISPTADWGDGLCEKSASSVNDTMSFRPNESRQGGDECMEESYVEYLEATFENFHGRFLDSPDKVGIARNDKRE